MRACNAFLPNTQSRIQIVSRPAQTEMGMKSADRPTTRGGAKRVETYTDQSCIVRIHVPGERKRSPLVENFQ